MNGEGPRLPISTPLRRGQAARWTRWLAAAFAGPVEPDLLRTLPPDEGWPAAAEVRARFAEGACAALESERVRLFVNAPGGVVAPFYGSWWIDGRLHGPSTARVEETFRRAGLEIAPVAGPADALPVELEFLEFLLRHERAAEAAREPAWVADARSREAEFVAGGLLPWLPRFCARVREGTREPAWSAAATLVEALVRAEAGRLGAPAPEGPA